MALTTDLPISEVLEELGTALGSHSGVVLQAPPGAGKTTCVPLFLMEASWMQGKKILMLAPRRLAARAAARRMSQMLGESIGGTVGYRVRMDTRVGPRTRIEVITEGVLLRMLHNDPSLEGVGLVIFDEFHERSMDADAGLAFCLDIQGVLSEHLKLLVMSATMETGKVSDLLGGVPVIEARGRSYPVETRYVGDHTPSGSMAEVTRAVQTAVRNDNGSILVFLPGAAEIRQVARNLEAAALGPQWMVTPLLGSLDPREQDRAIAPAPRGYRKIVLATDIAETSLTIDGIAVVVDSGLQRRPQFDVQSGMSRLVTMPVSRASADQRLGRAGRLGPGVCLRLWSKSMNDALAQDQRPEILEADLCGLALELAQWGVRQPDALKWITPPPEGAYAAACELLKALDALNPQGKITNHGRRMAAMPVHPRLGHMLLMAHGAGNLQAACDLAALLSERDPMRFEAGKGEVDLQLRCDLLQARRKGRSFSHPQARVHHRACKAIADVADRLHDQAKNQFGKQATKQTLSTGEMLAWAYPDRIARRRKGDRERYATTGGQGVRLNPNDPLCSEEFIVAVETDGNRRDGRVFRAAAYAREALETQYAGRLAWQADIHWDSQRQVVTARRILRMDVLTLRAGQLQHPEEQAVLAAMLQGIVQNGLAVLPWNKSLRGWQARVCFLHNSASDKSKWPDLSDQTLAATMDSWLAPFLSGITSLRGLARIDLRSALLSQLPHDRHRKLEELAPTHWTVPSGSRIPIDYSKPVPVLAVRLQEMFGLEKTPAVDGGRRPLLVHLLSPAGRPVQITQDLAGFWKSSYHAVKKDLKGRYPKHHWPDDPLNARATSRAKPRK